MLAFCGKFCSPFRVNPTFEKRVYEICTLYSKASEKLHSRTSFNTFLYLHCSDRCIGGKIPDCNTVTIASKMAPTSFLEIITLTMSCCSFPEDIFPRFQNRFSAKFPRFFDFPDFSFASFFFNVIHRALSPPP